MLSLIDRSDDRCVGPHADGIAPAMKNNCIIVFIARMYDGSDRRRNEAKDGREGGTNSWWLKLIAKR